jgi:cytochrome P450
MTYINQIIKETLRINGPATRVLPRVAKEDTDLGGKFIPKGTWLPFGNGARQCIGMNFSLNEQRVLLSMLCKYFIIYLYFNLLIHFVCSA